MRGRSSRRQDRLPSDAASGILGRCRSWSGGYDADMALINCPECGHEVSSAASACPNCGHPVNVEGADLVRALQAREAVNEESRQSVEDLHREGQKPWAWVTLAAGIGLVFGSLLPWATLTAPFVGTVNVTATDGDGIITLIAGLVVGLMGILALIRGVGPLGLVFLFMTLGLAMLVAVVDLGNITDVVAEFDSEDFGATSVGIGLWLVTVATVIGFIGFGGLLMNRSKMESENKSLRDWFNWI